MRDGRTRKLGRAEQNQSFDEFAARWRAAIVILCGRAAGTEHALRKPNTLLGRGPGVELAFEDSAMSREHAAVEFTGGGFRIRDLGSMNGTFLNGSEVKSADLSNGDRLQIGEHAFQFVLEQAEKKAKVYVLPDA